MNTVNEKVNLNVKLQLHRLHIFGPQRQRDELHKLLKEGLSLSLIKKRQQFLLNFLLIPTAQPILPAAVPLKALQCFQVVILHEILMQDAHETLLLLRE